MTTVTLHSLAQSNSIKVCCSQLNNPFVKFYWLQNITFFFRFAIGDFQEHFCLQSVSKCLHYPIVLEDLTAEMVCIDNVLDRVFSVVCIRHL